MRLVIFNVSFIKFVFVIILLWFTDNNLYATQKSVIIPIVKNKCIYINNSKSCTKQTEQKKIMLNSVELSDETINKLKKSNNSEYYNLDLSNSITRAIKYSKNKSSNTRFDLGMGNVPVLDQGYYGTCTVFAVTAVIEALNNNGNYISQQCLLELGNHLEHTSDNYLVSGWDGAEFEEVLNRIRKFGIIDNDSCPDIYADSNKLMSTQSYNEYSYNAQLSNSFNWKYIYNLDDFGDMIPASIQQIKEVLHNGHRVLIGSLLLSYIIDGKSLYGKSNVLWDLPNNYDIRHFFIDSNKNRLYSHAMIITGYDDNKQVFKIRNSWGPEAGDNGNYYMTYRYFDAMNEEAIEIY